MQPQGVGSPVNKGTGRMSQIVLLAEDEPLVSNFVSLSLERAGFVVFLACNAEKARQVFRNEVIDLLLTDVQMGDGMNGVELAERIMEEQPGTKVLVMSGFPEKEVLTKEGSLPFLRKPFTIAILTDAIREVLGSQTPATQSEMKTRLDEANGRSIQKIAS
jgi:DNA-binding NtrC family response regulator